MDDEIRGILELEAAMDRASAEAHKIRFSSPARAVKLCLEVVEQAQQIKAPTRSLKNQLGRLQIILSNLYIRLNAYDKSLTQAFQANVIYRDIDLASGVARSHNAIGLANLRLGSYADALGSLLSALERAETLQDARLKADVLNNLGLLYLEMEDFTKALTYLEQGIALIETTDHTETLADLYKNICLACLNLGQYNQALKHGQKGIELYQHIENRYGEARTYNTVGEVYAAMGHTLEALNYFQQSLEICTIIDDIRGRANAYYLIGSLEFEQGNLDEAFEHLNKGLEFAQRGHDTPQTYHIHRTLSKAYREKEDFQQALEHFKKYHDAREAVFDQDMSTRIKSLEIMHQVRETQQDTEIYRLKNVELTREIEERKKAQSELEHIVTLDPLTGLNNRRHFFELTRQEMERSRRYNRPLSVIMLDIDHFKRVNDQFGHLVGDRVIVEVARRIQKALRRIDQACRYGGEEFAVLLPETSIRQAEMVARRLWQLVTKQPTVSGELRLKITVSVGVACYQQEGHLAVDTLLDRADRAMYAAKQAGRNQVMVYSDEINGRNITHKIY